MQKKNSKKMTPNKESDLSIHRQINLSFDENWPNTDIDVRISRKYIKTVVGTVILYVQKVK